MQLPITGRIDTYLDRRLAKGKIGGLQRTPWGLVQHQIPKPRTPRPGTVIEGTKFQIETSQEYLQRYSDMVREGHKEDFTNAVNLMLPKVKGVEILTDGMGNSYLSALTSDGVQLPLSDLGGGIVRLSRLLLSCFASRDGMLLADEIENGMHHSMLVTSGPPRVGGCTSGTYSSSPRLTVTNASMQQSRHLQTRRRICPYTNSSWMKKREDPGGNVQRRLPRRRPRARPGGPMIARDANAKRPKRKILSDRLLLVEGKDEENLFDALIRRCFGAEPELQVIAAGGRDKFPTNLEAIHTAALARPTLRAIGVVRDADETPTPHFKASATTCGTLDTNRRHPRRVFRRRAVNRRVIMPDGEAPGVVETLCRRSSGGDDVSKCVEEYMRCLSEQNAMRSTNVDKTFAHAYLAAMGDPVARVGEGALQGVWDFGSPSFSELSGFLRRPRHDRSVSGPRTPIISNPRAAAPFERLNA